MGNQSDPFDMYDHDVKLKWTASTSDTKDENDQLKAENAELRKLVQDMYKAFFTLDIDQCQACPREDDCVYMYRVSDCMQCAFERDMRELGIEVGA